MHESAKHIGNCRIKNKKIRRRDCKVTGIGKQRGTCGDVEECEVIRVKLNEGIMGWKKGGNGDKV